MDDLHSWLYPDIPEHIADLLFTEDKHLVIVGVIGNSTVKNCNKLGAFDILDRPVSAIQHTPKDGQIQFYYKPTESMLILHFETTSDSKIMEELLMQEMVLKKCKDFFQVHHSVLSRYARTLLFLFHVCHLCVYVADGPNIDATFVKTLSKLQYIRERHVQKFLPTLLTNAQIDYNEIHLNFGQMCTPRLLFLFESYPVEFEKSKDDIKKLEFDIEDHIYSILSDEEIIGNGNASLIAIPSNNQFVYLNTNEKVRADVGLESQKFLIKTLKTAKANKRNYNGSTENLSPFKGIGLPYYEEFTPGCNDNEYSQAVENFYHSEHTFMNFLLQHVEDAFLDYFNDNRLELTVKNWYEIFKIMHTIFIENQENPEFKTDEPEYEYYLENFDTILNSDKRFFTVCCKNGLKRGLTRYKQLATSFYTSIVHNNYLEESLEIYKEYARGTCYDEMEQKLRGMCQSYWENGRMACEKMSLRGYPCIQSKEIEHSNVQHKSGQVFISSCNCGRTQGHRDDPYSIRLANYAFYECLAAMCCHCAKVKRISFSTFKPSSSEYRAAAFEMAFPISKPIAADTASDEKNTSTLLMDIDDQEDYEANECSQPMSASFGPNFTLSQNFSNDRFSQIETSYEEEENGSEYVETSYEEEESDNRDVETSYEEEGSDNRDVETSYEEEGSDNKYVDTSYETEGNDNEYVESDSDSIDENELVLQIKDKTVIDSFMQGSCEANSNELTSTLMHRQASTTEYLPGLVHTLSVEGLLPLFPSWSLVCVGSSSIYSHSNGLMEHFQSGFLSNSNFLLPWHVHVRLQRILSIGELNGKGKPRRFRKSTLKIFVGFEYECGRGHRFIMSSPNKVLRGSSDIVRDSGSNVVNNNMPLYFPCPCHPHSTEVAQLMRIHVVTPKAPVNVIVDPKVRTGEQNFIFTLGQETPPKLSQSAYWILRLPYVYQGDDVIIMPPTSVTANDAMQHGCLLAGMFGVAETNDDI